MTAEGSASGQEPTTGGLVQLGLDEPALQAIAGRVSAHLEPPLVIYLEGDLGAGKTTWVRALLRALGYTGPVKSPTYGLMEGYEVPMPQGSRKGRAPGSASLRVLHLDLYRIADPGEVEFLALGDLLDASTVLCVEWPGQGAGALPAPDITVSLRESERSGSSMRDFHCYAHSDSGIKLCKEIDAEL